MVNFLKKIWTAFITPPTNKQIEAAGAWDSASHSTDIRKRPGFL